MIDRLSTTSGHFRNAFKQKVNNDFDDENQSIHANQWNIILLTVYKEQCSFQDNAKKTRSDVQHDLHWEKYVGQYRYIFEQETWITRG